MIPPWINIANDLLGTKETPGNENNIKILAWAKVLGGKIEQEYIADSIPWCGLFVAYCFAEAGIKPVTAPLWALNWSKFGISLKKPCFGCVISMSRTGGGHVGFVVAQDSTHWHVLGGNQSDMVNITRVPKITKTYFNWPSGKEFSKFVNILPFKPWNGTISNIQKFD